MPVLAILPINAPRPAPTAIRKHRDEDQHAEQEPPEHSPRRAGAHGVVGCIDAVLAIRIATDDRDCLWLDEVLGEAAGLVGSGLSRGLVR